MDWIRIAAMLRGPASGSSRRAALARLAAAFAAFCGGGAPAASRESRTREPRAEGAGRRCRSNKDCLSRSCNSRAGRCRCSAGGKKCRKPSDCCSGLQCSSGACGQADRPCGPSTCPSGCCRNGACLPGNTADACGAVGGACRACTGSVAPVCRGGTCAAGTWTHVGEFGTGIEGTGDDQFQRTRGVALSPDGLTAWIADTMNDRVSIWSRPNVLSATWSPVRRFGSNGSGQAELASPASLALAPDALTLWICDRGNGRISVWARPSAASAAWAPSTTFGADRLSNPSDVVVAPDTLTAFVADSSRHRVYVWTRPNASSLSWTYHSDFGFEGDLGALWIPYGIFVSPDSRTAWVTSYLFGGVSTWTRPDASSRAWGVVHSMGSNTSEGGDLYRPSDVIVSADSLTMWVLAQWGQHITIWRRPSPDSLDWRVVNASSDHQYISVPGFPEAFALSADERTMLVTNTIGNRVMAIAMT